MLKKLELIGFKSFADKTVFDFAAGITAVVGPNGSGKSNVVDAVKWVLGEQSAKSLRGGAMADVIFNGSTSRRPFPHAEVTLTFDNAKVHLATDLAEVRVTRRVHRDGTGEYLINGQPCRLKDIKNLFLGTGAGSGAYSIIEQGRVDALLQTAQDDRRAIFEEAAGVSRFRLKKIECLRRLERVGQNLDRLNDILGGVDAQLKSVRAQATKAQKYQELANRLKDLRLGVALGEYRELSDQAAEIDARLADLRRQLAEFEQAASTRGEQIRDRETRLAELDTELRTTETAQSDVKARTAACLVERQADRDRLARLEDDLATDRRRWADAIRARGEAESAAIDALARREQATSECDQARAAVDALAERSREASAELAQLRTAIEEQQAEHIEQLRAAGRWHNDAVGVKARIDQLRRERDRLTSRSSATAGQLAGLGSELASLQAAVDELQTRADVARSAINTERAKRNSAGHRLVACQSELAELRAEAAGLGSRIELLEAWDTDHDAATAGIRHVFDHAAELRGTLVAWVADVLTVDRADAPLIDVVLGPLAQSFVVQDWDALTRWLDARGEPLPGRVGFLAVGDDPTMRPMPAALVGQTSALTFVRSEVPGLAERLLAGTFVVDDLATARRLAARAPGYRFVTRSGEVLEADGTLTLGAARVEAGVIARKSEIRELRARATAVAERVSDCESEVAALEDRIAVADAALVMMTREAGVLNEQRQDLVHRASRLAERQSGLQQELALSQTELSGLDAEIDRGDSEWKRHLAAAEWAEAAAAHAKSEQQRHEQAVRERERSLQQHQQASTTAQVALAQARERLTTAGQRHAEAARAVSECDSAIEALTRRVSEGELRVNDLQLALLRTESELADLAARQEHLAREMMHWSGEREQVRAELRALHADHQSGQDRWQAARDEVHARELTARDLHLRRDALVARFAEDYQIDLATCEPTQSLGDLTPEQARAEAEELRKKVQKLGGVNLEALEELAVLEQKYHHLRTQYDDLTAARQLLDDIIQKINTDSKRLFLDTFAAIRVHFQDLFRRLFGGGMADIVLENPDDPLETPIDIIARPPGKELRSIGLMSGGERTMTAVALLLAIFRSKPSPFCLLDEVDAALDEANTARLTAVLREFAATSQFIVITHAKRTMAAADVLYGVTMQESGVSKRVAVRFDEWADDQRRAA